MQKAAAGRRVYAQASSALTLRNNITIPYNKFHKMSTTPIPGMEIAFRNRAAFVWSRCHFKTCLIDFVPDMWISTMLEKEFYNFEAAW